MNGDTREWWIVQSATLRFTVVDGGALFARSK
jgi:hypothetical protein